VSLSVKSAYLIEKLKELSSTPAWSGQVNYHSEEDGKLTIQVRNRFVRDWIRESFLPSLQKEFETLPGEDLSIQFSIVPLESSEEVLENRTEIKESVPSSYEAPPKPKAILHETLKSKYSFDSFVVGASNQFAHAAAQAVVAQPAKNYNPLFIYGGVGLGKTHLLNAIGLESLRKNPRTRVIYLSAEKFMNELIQCLRFEKMSDFRKKYRESCDLLLVDDVQFIAGKERTQEEFFHTFNYLHEGQKQIVLTSDKPPRDIPGLEERLRSRFEWGLIADIQVPDLETRMAILKKKAEEDQIPLADDVALFLATHIKSNVRELEGSLIRVNAFASLGKQTITVPFVKDVLKNVLGGIERLLTVEQVQKMVADYYNIKLPDLTGKRRIRSLALPRQIAMYLCRKHVKSSYPEIGNKFGGKDHSTVVHAFSKIQKVIETDLTLREQVQALEQNLTR
jgi:chromosomal replication initiator protein